MYLSDIQQYNVFYFLAFFNKILYLCLVTDLVNKSQHSNNKDITTACSN